MTTKTKQKPLRQAPWKDGKPWEQLSLEDKNEIRAAERHQPDSEFEGCIWWKDAKGWQSIFFISL